MRKRQRFKRMSWLILLAAISAHIPSAWASRHCFAEARLLQDNRLTLEIDGSIPGIVPEFHRGDIWHPVGTGRNAGAAFFEAKLPNTNERHDREYAPVLHFSDGTVAVFTGVVDSGLGDDRAPNGRTCYTVAGNAKTIGPGQTRLADSAQPTAPGYVAFGRPKVINRGSTVFVVDHALPQWALEFILNEADKAASAYADRLGKRKLPLVMVYASGDGNPYFWGDHLDGTLTLGLYGNWRTDEAGLRAKLREFIDHEMFHVWNASAADRTDPTSLLPLEGGAELARALLTFDRTRNASLLLGEVSDAMTRCLLEQSPDTSLRMALGNPRPGRIPYDCGMVLMFTGTVRPAGATLDDGLFWRSWKHVGSREKKYTLSSVVNAELPVMPIRTLDKVLDASEFSVAAGDAVRAYGYRTSPRSSMPPDLASLAGQRIVSSLMSSDCDGRYGFFSTPAGYRLDDPLPTCKNFEAGKTIRDIAGVKPWINPIVLNEKIRELCAVGKPVMVTYADSEVPSSVSCDHSLRSFDFSQIFMGSQ